MKCPEPKVVITDPDVLKRADQMYEQTLKDGRERGAVLRNGPNGKILIGPTILGTRRNASGMASVPGLRNVPDDAIGVLHTHPAPGSGGFIGPSGNDSVHAANNHVMSVVRDRGGVYILTMKGAAAYQIPRTP